MQVRMFNGYALLLETRTSTPENEEEAADKATEKLRERRIKNTGVADFAQRRIPEAKMEAVTLHNYGANPQSATCKWPEK